MCKKSMQYNKKNRPLALLFNRNPDEKHVVFLLGLRVVEFDVNDTVALIATVTKLKGCSAVTYCVQSSRHVGHATAPFVSVGIDETALMSILQNIFFEGNLPRESRKEARKARDLIKLFKSNDATL